MTVLSLSDYALETGRLVMAEPTEAGRAWMLAAYRAALVAQYGERIADDLVRDLSAWIAFRSRLGA